MILRKWTAAAGTASSARARSSWSTSLTVKQPRVVLSRNSHSRYTLHTTEGTLITAGPEARGQTLHVCRWKHQSGTREDKAELTVKVRKQQTFTEQLLMSVKMLEISLSCQCLLWPNANLVLKNSQKQKLVSNMSMALTRARDALSVSFGEMQWFRIKYFSFTGRILTDFTSTERHHRCCFYSEIRN